MLWSRCWLRAPCAQGPAVANASNSRTMCAEECREEIGAVCYSLCMWQVARALKFVEAGGGCRQLLQAKTLRPPWSQGGTYRELASMICGQRLHTFEL